MKMSTNLENQIDSEIKTETEKLEIENKLSSLLDYMSKETQLTHVWEFLKLIKDYKIKYNGKSNKEYETGFSNNMYNIFYECMKGANPVIGMGVVNMLWDEIKKSSFEKDTLDNIKGCLNERIRQTSL